MPNELDDAREGQGNSMLGSNGMTDHKIHAGGKGKRGYQRYEGQRRGEDQWSIGPNRTEGLMEQGMN